MNDATLILALAALLLVGCAKFRARPAPPPPKPPAIVPVITPAETEPAKIAQVNATHRFVIVDFGRATPPAAGSRLTVVRHHQPVAVLQLTESRRGRFAAADLLEGDPKVGDEVLFPR